MKAGQNNIILMGDVIRSSEEKGVQQLLHKAVDDANDQLWSDIPAPFEITRGDEVALVAHVKLPWFTYMLRFVNAALPLKLRWVAVWGEITEGLDSKSSAEMMGPGFITADNLMKELKKSGMMFGFRSPSGRVDEQVSGIINMYLVMLNDLTPFQIKVLRHYQRLKTQQAAADALGKSQQQIQKSLQSIHWKTFDLAEKAIKDYITQVSKEFTNQSK